MSHQYYKPAKSRLQRSELAVPGSSPKMFEKALNSNADFIFLDLEDAQQLKDLNIGISTSVGIGGDPISGSSFKDIIEKFEQDNETEAVLMIGEIGGPQEVAAGEFVKENMKKPVIAYIAGLAAPKGRVMEHAGAIVSAYGESAVEKVELLKQCGVTISKNPSVMGETVKSAINGKKS